MDSTAIQNSFAQMSDVAGRSKGWLKFLGVLSIIGGALTALSIVGILIAWLPIWMGVLLFQAGSQVDSLQTTNDPTKLVTMMNKLRTYFVIQGILAIITLAVVGLGMLIGGGSFLALLQALSQR